MVTTEAWDKQYREKGYFIKYPDENLIRFMTKYFYDAPDRKGIKILDVGSGVGRNTIYLAKEGFSAFGVEATDYGIEISERRQGIESVNAVFKKADLTKIPFTEEYFDAVVDIQAIQHNTYKEINEILQEMKIVLKPNGMFFANMVSTQDHSFKKGGELRNIHLMRSGKALLSVQVLRISLTLMNLKEFESIFTEVDIERTETTFNNMKEKNVYWLITAKR